MNPAPAGAPSFEVVGRYAIFDEIAAGGMATIHLGRLIGEAGFSRVVAIKRLHPQFAKDAEFVAMFLDEARLAARIHHTNVVQTLDVVTADKELLLVMEYVHGVSFAALVQASRKARQRVDARLAVAVVVAALEGLHAAHEAKSEVGAPLGVVHRDVSPQNVMVGADGVPRILDFGVAKAVGKMHATREGHLKGKLAYMSPEQVRSVDVTRQSDVFSASIVLWEALMGQRLFDGSNPAELIMQVLSQPIEPPLQRFPDLPPALDAVVMKGLSRDPATRYATARDMALDLEAALPPAPPREVARWVESLSSEALSARSQVVERIERTGHDGGAPQTPATGVHEGAASGTKPRAPAEPKADPYAPTFEALTPVSDEQVARRSPATPRAPALSDSGTRARPPPQAAARAMERTMSSAQDPGDSGTPAGADFLSPPAPVEPPAARPPVRIRPMSIEPEKVGPSLWERLENPLKVVAAGVLLSVADPLLRPFLGGIPVRPLHVAGVLVVAGILWIAARLLH